MFTSGEKSFSAVEPRFSLLLSPVEQTRIFASLTAVNQFLHPYRASGVFAYYPTIFWYPSDKGIPPSTLLQASLGLQRGISEDLYVVTAEAFYEITQSLHEIDLRSLGNPNVDLYDAVLSGTGRSYGIELSIRKRAGDMTGSIMYTLARTEQMFPEINGDVFYRSPLDRRHEIQMEIAYQPDDMWLFGVLGVLVSGEAPISQAAMSASPPYVRDPGVAEAMAKFIDINGAKLPGFERLELKVACNFHLGQLPAQIAVRLVNGYGLLDPIGWELRPSSDLRFAWRAGLKEMRLFPLFPTVGMIVRF
jgi:hypothetical protein